MASSAQALKLALQIAVKEKDPAMNPPKRRSTAARESQKTKNLKKFTRGYFFAPIITP